ncbi:DUF4054 domain-containing protein [Bosea sp. 2KB_26]|uniref:DUF4054 domain-containing protein n=1 Tax=Bosea sp. 2KB_26 TaxID=3237475 RepID=UPI003F8E33C3
MAITHEAFVAAFPEFANLTVYPQSQFDFWSAQAYLQLNAGRFGPSLDLAAMLFVAHNIVLSAQASRSAATGGGTVSGTAGLVASKAVDKVSVSYDTTTAAVAGAGLWNATVYGQRLYQMMRAFGVGPVYFPNRRFAIP